MCLNNVKLSGVISPSYSRSAFPLFEATDNACSSCCFSNFIIRAQIHASIHSIMLGRKQFITYICNRK